MIYVMLKFDILQLVTVCGDVPRGRVLMKSEQN